MIRKFTIFLFLVLCFSCEEQGFIVNCPDCFAEEPMEVLLELKLEKSYNGNFTLINVYEGNLEDSVIYTSFTTTSSQTTLNVPLYKKYTVTATYEYPDATYIAVDSSTPRVKYEKQQCDKPCYYIYDRVYNLRLKYTK